MQKSIILLLVLLPFIHSHLSYSPFEIPKTWIIILAAILSVVAYLYQNTAEKQYKKSSTLLIVLVGLWVWLLFTSLLGGGFWDSWIGNPYRSDGLLVLSAMIILGLSLKLDSVLWWGISWGSIAMSVMTIAFRGHTALFMGNPNFLAGYLAVTLPLTHKRGVVPVLLQMVAIFMLSSWGGILCVLTYLVIVSLGKYWKLMVVALALILGGVIWRYRVDELSRHMPLAIVAESRERIWMKAGIAIKESPVFGYGWAQFGPTFTMIDWPYHYLVDAYVDRTHASLTEYTVAGGVPALLLYGYISLTSIVWLFKDRSVERRTLGLVMLLYMVYSQTNVTSVVVDWLYFASVGEAIRIQMSQSGKLTT